MCAHQTCGGFGWLTVGIGCVLFASAAYAQKEEGASRDQKPEKHAAGEDRNDNEGRSDYWLGLVVGPVRDTLRTHLGLPEDQGLLVLQVVDDSPAQKAESSVTTCW